MSFWLLFILVNFTFFLVPYLVNFKEDPNPIRFFIDKKVTLKSKLIFPYLKMSSDPFKFNFDYSIFLLIALVFGWSGLAANIVGGFVGMFTWVVITYYAVIIYILGRKPIIKSDYELALFGLELAKNKLILVWAAVILILVAMYALSFKFTEALLSFAPNKYFLGLTMLGLLVLGLYKFRTTGYFSFHLRTVLSSSIYLWRNVEYSKKYNFIANQKDDFFEAFNYYQELEFAQKPNINILCVESYGSVVFKEKELSEVRDYIASFDEELSSKGYHVATALSTPPLFAGGSWKSYTSLSYGTKVEDDTQYALMFKDSKGFKRYQSIFHILRDQGYKNILLTGQGKEIDEKFDWDLLKNNFQYDEFYDWNKLKYQGKEIKFFGVRDCPPDQFTLNKGYEMLEKQSDGPRSSFFISLNSHYPYNSPVKCLDDWKELDDPDKEIELNVDDSNVTSRYKSAIKYQMETFLTFISERANKDEVYILFGDHQPPFVAKKNEGWETPIHVFSKDEKLLIPFLEQGYTKGLVPDTSGAAPLRHEGFLSLFLKGLNLSVGKNKNLDLPYRPNGAVFQDLQN